MSKLYQHENHPHQPVAIRVEDVHHTLKREGGLNAVIAVGITRVVGSMWTAYAFTVLAVVGLLGLLGILNPLTFLLATWVSQMFLQLVFLPILSVGQSVLGKHQEMVNEETAKTTQKSYHQLGQIVKHLNAQDDELLKISDTTSSDIARLTHLVEALDAELSKNTRILLQLQKKASGV